MSAPESNSKVPPSLLSEPAKDGQAGGSRILANLEGRVDPSANTKPKRSRTLPVVAAALVIIAGGVGAYQLQHRSSGVSAEKVAANGASTVVASNIKVASGVTANASASAASVPAAAPATIVSDDDATRDTQRAQASNDDGSRLSRALADGAATADEAGSAAIVSSAKSGDAAKPASAANAKQADTASSKAAHDKRRLAEDRHLKESKAAVVSSAKKKPSGKQEPKDDSDADLLAALVARTKPASSNGGKAGDAQVASKKVSSTSNSTATLAERINECGQHGFFEEQLCRWRVCDGHWGKDPHCPAASAQARQP